MQSQLFFNKLGSDALVTNEDCMRSDTRTNGISVVRRATLGVMGRATLCHANEPVGGEWPVTGFVITIASACGTNWYSGTETPASGQCDLASTIVHEIGHGIGHGFHFDDPSPPALIQDATVCKPAAGDDDAQTMCSGEHAPVDSTWMRTLGVHDNGTLNNAYANWPAQPTGGLPPPDGGGLPDDHCYDLDDTDDPKELVDNTIDTIGDALVEPDDRNIYGIPVCAV